MTAFKFPQDRETFLYSGPGEPIRQAGQGAVWIYLDEEATTLAVINEVDGDEPGDPIAGSVVFVGANGLLPEFYGPDGVVELWAKSAEDDIAYVLEANYRQRIEAIDMDALIAYVDEQVATRETPAGAQAKVDALRTLLEGGSLDAALDTLKEIGDLLEADSASIGTLLTEIATKVTASQVDTQIDVKIAAFDDFIKIKKVYADTAAALAGLALNEFADGDLIIILEP